MTPRLSMSRQNSSVCSAASERQSTPVVEILLMLADAAA
jgi:hypothetical protein